MTLTDSVRSALRALRVNALRSLLTMLGVTIGVAAVVALVALGAGAERRIADEIRSLGANLLLVQPVSRAENGARLGAGSRTSLTVDDAAAIAREVPSVLIAAPGVQTVARTVNGPRNWRTTVVGARPDYLAARDWPLARGRSFTIEEVERGAKVAVIGSTVAERLFEGADPLGSLLRIADVPFTVVGVLAEKGASPFGGDQDDVAFAPLSTARLRLPGLTRASGPGAVDHIYVKAAGPEALDDARRQIGALLRQRHRLRADAPDDFSIDDLAALVSAQQRSGRTFTIFLAVVASISLIVGGISIMNIMLVSVTERTREIGLRLAVGARPRDLLAQFLVETVVLCLAGAAIGVALGAAAAHAVGATTGWAVAVTPWSVALAVGFAAAIGVFFGFWPALRAARLDPLEALRRE